jgi:hypothetical protein
MEKTMSERSRNSSTALICLGIGAVLLILAMTPVPGSLAAIPVGVVMFTIGIVLVMRRKTQ